MLATVSKDIAVAGGDTLTFTDLSLGVIRRTWTFPGGVPETSDKAAPNVVFLEEGNSSPKLVVEYFDGTKDSLTLPITVYPILIADFTPSVTRIKVGETVTFTDASIGGADGWYWEFEGGTPATSTEQNPTVQFDVNKPISVTLTVTRSSTESENTVIKDAIVQVGPPELAYYGSFEDQQIIDYQTWNGAGFPLEIVEGGANGTNYACAFDYEDWGGAEIMNRDKPEERKIEIIPGRSYTVSLYMKADDAGVLTIGWFQLGNLNSWDEGYKSSWGTNGQVLTTDWQLVSFVTTIPTDNGDWLNAYHNFWLTKVDGGATVNTRVYMDELSLKIVDL
ncbi:MAG: hypothetical protein P1P88_15070 [Bacteroidales bacterium]|nr:hypothetical protein [Bacteroidales bacterium]